MAKKNSRARNWFGNRERLKVLNDTKLIQNDLTHADLGPIWYYSEPSPNRFPDLDFFCHFLQQDCSSSCCWAKFTFSNFLLLIPDTASNKEMIWNEWREYTLLMIIGKSFVVVFYPHLHINCVAPPCFSASQDKAFAYKNYRQCK